MTDVKDRTIIKALQGDIPLTEEPFAFLAQQLGCSQEEALEAIRDLKRRGGMRRFGAVLAHRRAGFIHNAMVMWEVPESRIDEAGTFMASFQEVSHCYLRETPAGWPYNIYCMIHARTSRRIKEIVTTIVEQLGISNYRVVKSLQEFKKTSMTYF